jgi:hypothetical protein
MTEPREPSFDHEPFDQEVNFRLLLGLGAVLLALVAMALLVSYPLYRGLQAREAAQDPPPPVLQDARAPVRIPEPRLLPKPERLLGQTREEERARLESYGWVDQQGGVAHIPIERAMQLMLERERAAGSTPDPTEAGSEVSTPGEETDR